MAKMRPKMAKMRPKVRTGAKVCRGRRQGRTPKMAKTMPKPSAKMDLIVGIGATRAHHPRIPWASSTYPVDFGAKKGPSGVQVGSKLS